LFFKIDNVACVSADNNIRPVQVWRVNPDLGLLRRDDLLDGLLSRLWLGLSSSLLTFVLRVGATVLFLRAASGSVVDGLA